MQANNPATGQTMLAANDLLADWLEDFAKGVREEIAELGPEALAWQPRERANSIGVTVWHCARWLDVIGAQALRGLPGEHELWHTQGLAARTGYDPRGHGQAGLGNITGYTWDEVLEIPLLPAADLLAYLDQVTGALAAQLRAMSPEQLHGLVPGLGGRRSAYRWVRPILQGCFGHLGEIEAMKSWQA
jgi:hypothetical protein